MRRAEAGDGRDCAAVGGVDLVEFVAAVLAERVREKEAKVVGADAGKRFAAVGRGRASLIFEGELLVLGEDEGVVHAKVEEIASSLLLQVALGERFEKALLEGFKLVERVRVAGGALDAGGELLELLVGIAR